MEFVEREQFTQSVQNDSNMHGKWQFGLILAHQTRTPYAAAIFTPTTCLLYVHIGTRFFSNSKTEPKTKSLLANKTKREKEIIFGKVFCVVIVMVIASSDRLLCLVFEWTISAVRFCMVWNFTSFIHFKCFTDSICVCLCLAVRCECHFPFNTYAYVRIHRI